MNWDQWRASRNNFLENLLPFLQKYCQDITRDAKKGNKTALTIVDLYDMISASFDPEIEILLEKSINEYRMVK